MKKILAFDTSTEACSVALLVDNNKTERFEIAPRRHSDLLLQMIDELLAGAKIKLTELDALAFGCGPGSFMGVRLATAVAQGLAFSANIPVIPVSTLQTLAQRGLDKLQHNNIVAAWDARMGEIYWGAYVKNNDGIMMPLNQDQITAPEAIDVADDQSWALVGNAWELYRADLPTGLQLESHLFYPRATAMLDIAAYYLSKNQTVSAAEVEPNYLRMQVAFKKK